MMPRSLGRWTWLSPKTIDAWLDPRDKDGPGRVAAQLCDPDNVGSPGRALRPVELATDETGSHRLNTVQNPSPDTHG